MNHVVIRISLDIHKIESQAVVMAFQGDSGYTIIAQLTDNGRPYEIKDKCKAKFFCVKPDEHVLGGIECDIVNNTIVYDFLSSVGESGTCQTTAVAGNVKCQFKLIGSDGAIIASPIFDLIVNKPIFDEGKIGDSISQYNALTEYYAWLQSDEGKKELKGEKGEKGDQGIQGEKGEKGDKGDPYTLTESDKQEMVSEVLSALPTGDEVAY